MEQYQKLLDLLVEFAVSLLKIGIPILASYVAWRFSQLKIEELKISNNQSVNWFIQEVVRSVVFGVEGMKKSGMLDDKKEAAMNWTQSYLESRGIKIDLKELDLLIEASVKSEFNSPK